MLLLGSKLINIPIMSLQTGTMLATTKNPIIDPSNLKIIAYEVSGPMLSQHQSYIRIADVRELGNLGMIVDSNDEFIGIDDVIALKKIYDLNFNLIGLSVIDETGRRLGKVEDIGVDTDSFIVQQLHVKRGVIKSITDAGLLINRSQIIEINDRSVIVRTTASKLEPIAKTEKLTYMNPFRSTTPQTDSSDI